jgi:hypothetical protein
LKKDKNDSIISESELRTILDNLSRKYSIKVFVENNEEKMPRHIGYHISKNAVIVNIPMFLDMIKEQRKSLKFRQIENLIDAKFLHEYHHSKINRKYSTDEMPLINFCEDYYIENILMKNNESLIMENSYLREVYSERIEDDKLNIIIQDLNVIYMLCSIYDKEELKNIYGDEIEDYKKIFDTIKSESDIWNASSELLKLYLQRKAA